MEEVGRGAAAWEEQLAWTLYIFRFCINEKSDNLKKKILMKIVYTDIKMMIMWNFIKEEFFFILGAESVYSLIELGGRGL